MRNFRSKWQKCQNCVAWTRSKWSELKQVEGRGPYDNLFWGWRHGGPFFYFSSGHSHGRNFTLIFFEIADEVESRLPVFATKNQQSRFITLTKFADRVFEKKILINRQNFHFFLNWAKDVDFY